MREVPVYSVTRFKEKTARYAIMSAVKDEGERLHRHLKNMVQHIGEDFDIIISDAPSVDGSTAPEKLKDLGVTALLTLEEEGRLSSSWRVGFAFAMDEGYQGVVTIDGNGKDGTDTLHLFAKELDEGWDYVQGSRFIKGGESINTPWTRTFLIRFVHAPWMSFICWKIYTDSTNGYRGISRKFLTDERVKMYSHDYKDYELPFYMAWAINKYGYRTKEIPVRRAYPDNGFIPTKIVGFRRRWEMLKPLIMLTFRLWK